MKRWTPVIVLWDDACGADRGWEDPAGLPHKPVKVQTIGFLYKQNTKGITVVHNRDGDSIGGFTFIPACNVTSVRELG